MRIYGNFGVSVETDRKVSYADVENALNRQAILEGISISLTEVGGATRIHVTVSIPGHRITAGGIPPLPAVGTIRAVADALDEVEHGINA
jgi:hypothetical protein